MQRAGIKGKQRIFGMQIRGSREHIADANKRGAWNGNQGFKMCLFAARFYTV